MRSNWEIKPKIIFVTLCVLFLVFSFNLYLKPLKVQGIQDEHFKKAAEGRLVWQKYNCQSCHQLYGLGGYLGPDLTNSYRKINGKREALQFFLKAGSKQMPSFNLSDQEVEFLLEFLKFTDDSGSADPRDYEILSNGMIEQNERK